jgi:hypothetical protein
MSARCGKTLPFRQHALFSQYYFVTSVEPSVNNYLISKTPVINSDFLSPEHFSLCFEIPACISPISAHR